MDYIERYLEPKIVSRLFKGKAIILYGPRQCGKSTLMKHLTKEQSLDPIILTGDDDMDADLFETVTMSRWDQILGNKKTVFIDEGQKIKNLGRSVKLLIDARPEIQILITGSSSFSIATETQEPLTGRKYEYRLFPMSYGEPSAHFGYTDELNALETRLIFGSYPEVVAKPHQMKIDYLETQTNALTAFEFKWNSKKKARITKAFTNRYPDASTMLVNPQNYDSFLRLEPLNNNQT